MSGEAVALSYPLQANRIKKMNYTYLIAAASGEELNQILTGSFATLFAGAVFFAAGYLIGKWIWRPDRYPATIGESRERVNKYRSRESEMNAVRGRSLELLDQRIK